MLHDGLLQNLCQHCINFKENIISNLNSEQILDLNWQESNLNNVGHEPKNLNLTDKQYDILESYIDSYKDINQDQSIPSIKNSDLKSLQNEEFNLDFQKIADFDGYGDQNIKTFSNEL